MICLALRRYFLFALMFGIPLLMLSSCSSRNENYANRIVAKVNDQNLTAEEFAERLATRLKVFNDLSAKDSAVISQAKAAVIQDFIVRIVTKDWAQANEKFVRKEQLDAEISSVLKQYPDEIAFRKALADEGLSYDRWEENLKHTLLERLVTTTLRETIKKPSQERILAYYQNNKSLFQQSAAVHLRQIVLENDSAAQKIKKELSAGKSLALLAKKYSIASEASIGGDIGWIEKGYLDIFDKAFKLAVGQRSQVEKSAFGYHIYELIEKRPAKALSIEQAKSKIESILLAESEQTVYSSWLEEQILKARVFKDDDFIKSIKVQTRSLK